jgi:hypothetical protein
LVEDNRVSPADVAAFRLDFQAWLGQPPDRKRRIAEQLAGAHSTGELARELGVTPAVISQTRGWLARSWAIFQGVPDASNGRSVSANRGTIAGRQAWLS